MLDLQLNTLEKNLFTPYPYQQSAINSIVTRLYDQGERSAAIVVVTGGGKTVIMGCLLRQLLESGRISRALFLVHRTELVLQAYKAFERAGLSVGREQGSSSAYNLCNPHVVVSTVQTLAQRLDKFSRDEFDLILTDEMHHASLANKQYRDPFDYFESAKLVGVTATPDRADGADMTHFGEVVYKYSLFDAVKDQDGPFLAPPKFVRCSLGVDIRGVSTVGKKGDFQQGQLGEKMKPGIELLANAIAQETNAADRQKTIIFMPCVGSSTAMAHALDSLGYRAAWISGDHPDRDQILQDYKRGRYSYLVNCQLLTEGFDDPATDCVVLKPTRSRVAYSQMVGRCLRLFAGKTHGLIIDFSHTTDMDLIGPASLACADPEDESEINAEVNSDGDLWAAVERASTAKKARQEIKINIDRLKDMQYRRVEIDPFQAALDMGVRASSMTSKVFDDLATPRQAELLAKHGFADLKGMTKRQAGQLISQIISRRTAGLATIKQLNYLIHLGVKPERARSMTFQQASEEIDLRRSMR